MPSSISETIFSEPSGRPITLVHAAGALIFAGLYSYGWVVDGAPGSWLLIMVLGTGLAGIAEALPASRRQTAGVLRSVAILVLLSLVVASIAAPEFIVG
ncbi:hypothetical protein Har1130_01955 [Haloarcula sp. CBA1130]|uniref:hypothetical protein n=1 Tax=unclassified Haloarcula TaxID=2624677 RepID=UPI0012455CD2|nr:MULTISPECIES: hypothetical protein [unclassified Haloarcula]KAA9399870.1 hypothetical protein Har1129_17230 [Haloarcula sp. CBA1129]KAA9401565.1 hypothetical protein Har1130_01955 [Haloarcula sp. CBA1130]